MYRIVDQNGRCIIERFAFRGEYENGEAYEVWHPIAIIYKGPSSGVVYAASDWQRTAQIVIDALNADEEENPSSERYVPSYPKKQSVIADARSKYEEIRRLRSEGKTLQEIGDIFGITRERVRQIVTGL